ncbi:MAG: ABC transporter ATP-binding protein [Actinomycetaceae bacterium]|nr:ABC transporter ATP-binding protein [Actinomycetaceae bacterium]MDU0969830.1 ABC transporter ATP-binding protein [Actinomycetaceae bacterium]
MSPGGQRGVDPTASARNQKAALKALVRRLRPEAWRIILSLVLTAISVAANVAGPALLGRGTDIIFSGVISLRARKVAPDGVPLSQAARAARAAGHPHLADLMAQTRGTVGAGIDFGQLTRVLLVVLVAYAVAAAAMWAGGMLVRTAVQNTGLRLRSDVQHKIDRLPLSYLDTHARGDILSRVTNDVDNVTQTLLQTLSQLFSSLLQAVGILGMMIYLSWKLSIAALAIIPLVILVARWLMGRAQPHFGRQWGSTGQLSGTVEEAFTGQEVALLYGLEDDFADRFDRDNEQLFDASFHAQFFSGLMQPAMNALSNLSFVIVAVAGAILVMGGSLSLGAVQAFIQYSRQFTQPLSTLAQIANLLQSGAASAERIFDLLAAPDMEVDRGTDQPIRGTGVTFDHVVFGYEPGKPVITGLTLDVEAGHTVAIVGPTGAGKTTLVNLLMRFYEVDSGAIRLGGVDIRDLTKDALRSRFAMVLQDTWLLPGTVRENIAYGNPDATEDQILAAARASGVDDFVQTMAKGYDTQLSEEGARLSAGQKQLVTIARAFLADPQILILDEATSSVDTRTEILVQQAMERLRSGRTSFVIAHRLSTIRDADVIIVMQHGDVVEQGTHQQLLAAGGAYAQLYNAQFAETEA